MSGTNDSLRDIELLVRSHHPVLCIETYEEQRTAWQLMHVAARLGIPFFDWSPTKGLRRAGEPGEVYGTRALLGALQYMEIANFEALYYLRELPSFLEDPSVVSLFKEVAGRFSQHKGAIVIMGSAADLPAAIARLVTPVTMAYPTADEYYELMTRMVSDLRARVDFAIDLSSDDLEVLLRSLTGCTLMEAEKVLTQAIILNKKLSVESAAVILDSKRSIIEQGGVLEYRPHSETLDDIADLNGLKAWLQKRRRVFLEPELAAGLGLPTPKGILLLGVQGCGKSLCAKTVAQAWTLPLLKLDTSNLYNRFMGESERNLKKAMRIAEAMAPVVLWIDEIEKAFASSSGSESDGGVSKRMLGTFLSWLQERDKPIFVIATANDIKSLPPELIRKGRFDEIFFVDLPTEAARGEILRLHIEKRKHPTDLFDLKRLAEASDGFSGAELEQAVVSALYTVFEDDRPLSTETLLSEIELTQPLSRTMGEKIEELRAWAKGRAVPA